LFFQENFRTNLFDSQVVGNETVGVASLPVPVFQPVQTVARKGVALITEIDLVLAQELTVLFQESAVLVARPAAGALDAFLAFQPVFAV
jgi:hypothetical protein